MQGTQGFRKTNIMTLRRIAKIVTVIAVLTTAGTATANTNGAKNFDWDPIMDAITQVESEGDANAKNGNCVGAMQIAPILVEDCNNILEKRGEKRRYTLKDRFDVKKSREMFVIIQSQYNPTNNVERAIRLWNGGIRYKAKTTQRYYNKVMKELAKN